MCSRGLLTRSWFRTRSQEDGFRFEAATLELARVESNKCWRTPATHFERDNLLMQCDQNVIAPMRDECSTALDDACCDALKAAMVCKVDRDLIKAELIRQVARLPVHRIRHSFNKMSQGKTKVRPPLSYRGGSHSRLRWHQLLTVAVRLVCPFELQQYGSPWHPHLPRERWARSYFDDMRTLHGRAHITYAFAHFCVMSP